MPWTALLISSLKIRLSEDACSSMERISRSKVSRDCRIRSFNTSSSGFLTIAIGKKIRSSRNFTARLFGDMLEIRRDADNGPLDLLCSSFYLRAQQLNERKMTSDFAANFCRFI